MPKTFDLPEELFEFVVPSSDNPTINFCDDIVRKAQILNDKFRSHRQPAYMKSRSPTNTLPSILDKKRRPTIVPYTMKIGAQILKKLE